MRYNYQVINDGVVYPAGSKISAGLQFDITNKDNAIDNNKKYNKTEINRMPIKDLQKLASNIFGIDCSEKSGTELKEMLIKYYNA